MLIILIIECMLYSYLSINRYRDKLNPVTVMTIPWCLMVCGYEMRLVQYEDLTILTYLVVMLVIHVYSLAAIIAYNPVGEKKHSSGSKNQTISEGIAFAKRSTMRIVILAFTLVGAVPTLISLGQAISLYGVRFIYHVTDFYSARITGAADSNSIPYIGSLLYVSAFLSCIYLMKYKFEMFLCLPTVALSMRPFVSGGRQSLLEVIVIIIITVITMNNIDRGNETGSRRTKTLAFIGTVLAVLGGLLLFVSSQRSAWVLQANNYASPAFAETINRFPGMYQVYTYFTSPVGVLNAFLAHPNFGFGSNTLMPLYNLMNRFGLGIKVNRYQQFYFIPIRTNVGTAARELIEDYGVLAALLIVFACGWVLGKLYCECKRNPSIENRYLVSFGLFLSSLSWFSWMLRDANLIIALVVGVVICRWLDRTAVAEMNAVEPASQMDYKLVRSNG